MVAACWEVCRARRVMLSKGWGREALETDWMTRRAEPTVRPYQGMIVTGGDVSVTNTNTHRHRQKGWSLPTSRESGGSCGRALIRRGRAGSHPRPESAVGSRTVSARGAVAADLSGSMRARLRGRTAGVVVVWGWRGSVLKGGGATHTARPNAGARNWADGVKGNLRYGYVAIRVDSSICGHKTADIGGCTARGRKMKRRGVAGDKSRETRWEAAKSEGKT